jgi:N-acetylglucosamine-6-phosphate deacetylase
VSAPVALTGARLFDGRKFRKECLVISADKASVQPAPPEGAEVIDLGGGVLAPGFVDLQVNGGGGVMFNDDPSVTTLRVMAGAHASRGTTAILPTLITDTPEKSHAAVAAVEAAVRDRVPGIVGLHLEGPHLSPARKGAHDPALIRPMTDGDLTFLLDAARRLPRLIVTLAPESVREDQVQALAAAGAVVSLGHSDCTYATALRYRSAGARMVTHLFNAMSQIAPRAPGLAGAALADGGLSSGLIADGHHVHPATLALALAAKQGPGQAFLVSDAMATAGSDITAFHLGSREIRLDGGRLTLADGTLAGAHLDLARAVCVLVRDCNQPLTRALAMASDIPARIAGLPRGFGRLPGRADFIHIDEELKVRSVWQGRRVR